MNGNILEILREHSDAGYAAFTAKLIPNIPVDSVLGVRSPDLKRIAMSVGSMDDVDSFLNSLPHYYLEENNLHALLISKTKDFDLCIAEAEEFLPYINNWATCDTFSPDCFKRHKEELLPYIDCWLTGRLMSNKDSGHPYVIRFAIGMLMRHFLDEDFREDYLRQVAHIRHEDYYVRMMQAWYFATALAKQYEVTLQYLPLLDDWTRRKAIQKARESYRITAEQKQELLSYK